MEMELQIQVSESALFWWSSSATASKIQLGCLPWNFALKFVVEAKAKSISRAMVVVVSPVFAYLDKRGSKLVAACYLLWGGGGVGVCLFRGCQKRLASANLYSFLVFFVFFLQVVGSSPSLSSFFWFQILLLC
jgi:hypothetical protein